MQLCAPILARASSSIRSSISSRLKLKPFQLIGLNWLKIMHEQQLNGILGDEMVRTCSHLTHTHLTSRAWLYPLPPRYLQGLGKTVQTVAFLTHLLENGVKGPHIIVAPSSTLGKVAIYRSHILCCIVFIDL